MATRAAAAREAAFITSSLKSHSDLPVKVEASSKATKKQNAKSKLGMPLETANGAGETISDEIVENDVGILDGPVKTHTVAQSASSARKGIATGKKKAIIESQVVNGGWDELPHNMGKSGKAVEKALEVNGKIPVISEDMHDDKHDMTTKKKLSKPRSARRNAKKSLLLTPEPSDQVYEDPIAKEVKKEAAEDDKDTLIEATELKRTGRKRKSVVIYRDDSSERSDPKAKKQRKSSAKLDTTTDVQQKVDDLLESAGTLVVKAKRGKANPYGLSPGFSPFPKFVMPTHEACREVNRLLSAVHGVVTPPETIPPPSLEVTGCGEVPSVLDALIRTRLSAATTGTNSAYAFAGLVSRYGIREEGIGKGSVDWTKVRESNVEDIEKAIKRGGLAHSKAKDIKKILDMVHEQNIIRRDAFLKERDTGLSSGLPGTETIQQGSKDLEIAIVDQNVLSLDYMHYLTPDEAMSEFTKFPGIGVKTASCVILFCLRRPSFAVDTHVWRFCKWLKWVPEGATRDQTFSHCEVRVPDELKYSLHQLFLRHGKTCGRCRAATGESSEGWAETVCPLEQLVTRTGKRKGVNSKSPAKKISKKTKTWDGWSDPAMDDTPEPEGPELDDDSEEDWGQK